MTSITIARSALLAVGAVVSGLVDAGEALPLLYFFDSGRPEILLVTLGGIGMSVILWHLPSSTALPLEGVST